MCWKLAATGCKLPCKRDGAAEGEEGYPAPTRGTALWLRCGAQPAPAARRTYLCCDPVGIRKSSKIKRGTQITPGHQHPRLWSRPAGQVTGAGTSHRLWGWQGGPRHAALARDAQHQHARSPTQDCNEGTGSPRPPPANCFIFLTSLFSFVRTPHNAQQGWKPCLSPLPPPPPLPRPPPGAPGPATGGSPRVR